MKVLVHAFAPLFIEVDTETKQVLRAVIDIEDFKYEDPPLVTDEEGGYVVSIVSDEAYDIASENETDWWTRVELGSL